MCKEHFPNLPTSYQITLTHSTLHQMIRTLSTKQFETHSLGIFVTEQVPQLFEGEEHKLKGWHSSTPSIASVIISADILVDSMSQLSGVNLNTVLKAICKDIASGLEQDLKDNTKNTPLYRLGQGVNVWHRQGGFRGSKTANFTPLCREALLRDHETVEAFKR